MQAERQAVRQAVAVRPIWAVLQHEEQSGGEAPAQRAGGHVVPGAARNEREERNGFEVPIGRAAPTGCEPVCCDVCSIARFPKN